MSGDSSPKRRSVLKNPEDTAGSNAKKRRLSFKPKLDDRSGSADPSDSVNADPSDSANADPSNSVNAEPTAVVTALQYACESDEDEGILAENLKTNKLGLFYVPPYPNEILENFELNKKSEIMENLCATDERLDFHRLLHDSEGLNQLSSIDSRLDFCRLIHYSEGSATVMIVGDDILTGGFKRELQKVVDSTLVLRYVCKSSPSSSEALGADFFLFLLQLDTLESLDNLQATLKNMRQPMSLLCMRSSVIAISSSNGRQFNVIPDEDVHQLLVETQLSSIPYSAYSDEGRQFSLRRIYEKIKQCCSGNNMDLFLNYGLSSSFTTSDILST